MSEDYRLLPDPEATYRGTVRLVSLLLHHEFAVGHESSFTGSSQEEQDYVYGANVAALLIAQQALGNVLVRTKRE
jgi:hypothetical protein